MNIAIDIGGTKTLVALVDPSGQILNQIKFATPQEYSEFIDALSNTVKEISSEIPNLISMSVPGSIDRQNGIVKMLGNLPWIDKPIVRDVSSATGIQVVIIENDANLAALSEANSLENPQQRVMYVTFSTGIGTGFVVNCHLSEDLLDSEGGHMVFLIDGEFKEWEDMASGRAIVAKYGKKASEIDDPNIWREIAKYMAIGIVNNCALFMSDTVIIGGGVGTHFDKFSQQLRDEVDNLLPIAKMVPRPNIVGAKQAEEAVILGCIIKALQYEQHKQPVASY